MMRWRFTCWDVHRLDRRHSPVADRRPPGRRRGHSGLFHLAFEAVGDALNPGLSWTRGLGRALNGWPSPQQAQAQAIEAGAESTIGEPEDAAPPATGTGSGCATDWSGQGREGMHDRDRKTVLIYTLWRPCSVVEAEENRKVCKDCPPGAAALLKA